MRCRFSYLIPFISLIFFGNCMQFRRNSVAPKAGSLVLKPDGTLYASFEKEVADKIVTGMPILVYYGNGTPVAVYRTEAKIPQDPLIKITPLCRVNPSDRYKPEEMWIGIPTAKHKFGACLGTVIDSFLQQSPKTVFLNLGAAEMGTISGLKPLESKPAENKIGAQSGDKPNENQPSKGQIVSAQKEKSPKHYQLVHDFSSMDSSEKSLTCIILSTSSSDSDCLLTDGNIKSLKDPTYAVLVEPKEDLGLSEAELNKLAAPPPPPLPHLPTHPQSVGTTISNPPKGSTSAPIPEQKTSPASLPGPPLQKTTSPLTLKPPVGDQTNMMLSGFQEEEGNRFFQNGTIFAVFANQTIQEPIGYVQMVGPPSPNQKTDLKTGPAQPICKVKDPTKISFWQNDAYAKELQQEFWNLEAKTKPKNLFSSSWRLLAQEQSIQIKTGHCIAQAVQTTFQKKITILQLDLGFPKTNYSKVGERYQMVPNFKKQADALSSEAAVTCTLTGIQNLSSAKSTRFRNLVGHQVGFCKVTSKLPFDPKGRYFVQLEKPKKSKTR